MAGLNSGSHAQVILHVCNAAQHQLESFYKVLEHPKSAYYGHNPAFMETEGDTRAHGIMISFPQAFAALGIFMVGHAGAFRPGPPFARGVGRGAVHR